MDNALLHIPAGTTSLRLFIRLGSSAVTTGAGLTGLVYNTAGLTCYYIRQGAAPVAVTLATLASVSAAFSSGGFIEADATNMPGLYRFDLPNAALASGAESVTFHFKGAANLRPFTLTIQLTPVPADLRAAGGNIAAHGVGFGSFLNALGALFFGKATRTSTGATADDWKMYGADGTTQILSFTADPTDKNARSSGAAIV